MTVGNIQYMVVLRKESVIAMFEPIPVTVEASSPKSHIVLVQTHGDHVENNECNDKQALAVWAKNLSGRALQKQLPPCDEGNCISKLATMPRMFEVAL